jgi:hypothetical protein
MALDPRIGQPHPDMVRLLAPRHGITKRPRRPWNDHWIGGASEEEGGGSETALKLVDGSTSLHLVDGSTELELLA